MAKIWIQLDDAGECTGWADDTQPAGSWVEVEDTDARLVAWRIKTELIPSLRAERDKAQARFAYADHVWDGDDRAERRITGGVVAAQMAITNLQLFSVEWTTADNQDVTLDAAGMIGLGMALQAHTAAVHSRWRALRTQLEEAETLSAAQAIDITQGWPGD